MDTKINLCDTCGYDCIASCPAKDLEFGDGYGNDNVIKCDAYKAQGVCNDKG